MFLFADSGMGGRQWKAGCPIVCPITPLRLSIAPQCNSPSTFQLTWSSTRTFPQPSGKALLPLHSSFQHCFLWCLCNHPGCTSQELQGRGGGRVSRTARKTLCGEGSPQHQTSSLPSLGNLTCSFSLGANTKTFSPTPHSRRGPARRPLGASPGWGGIRSAAPGSPGRELRGEPGASAVPWGGRAGASAWRAGSPGSPNPAVPRGPAGKGGSQPAGARAGVPVRRPGPWAGGREGRARGRGPRGRSREVPLAPPRRSGFPARPPAAGRRAASRPLPAAAHLRPLPASPPRGPPPALSLRGASSLPRSPPPRGAGKMATAGGGGGAGGAGLGGAAGSGPCGPGPSAETGEGARGPAPRALHPEEVAARLQRMRRELSNRRKILVKNLPQDSSCQVPARDRGRRVPGATGPREKLPSRGSRLVPGALERSGGGGVRRACTPTPGVLSLRSPCEVAELETEAPRGRRLVQGHGNRGLSLQVRLALSFPVAPWECLGRGQVVEGEGGKLWSSLWGCQVFGSTLRGAEVRPGSSGLGCATRGGCAKELGAGRFVAAQAPDQVCVRPTLSLQVKANEWRSHHSALGSHAHPSSARHAPEGLSSSNSGEACGEATFCLWSRLTVALRLEAPRLFNCPCSRLPRLCSL